LRYPDKIYKNNNDSDVDYSNTKIFYYNYNSLLHPMDDKIFNKQMKELEKDIGKLMNLSSSLFRELEKS
jgi:hypothetical protein